MKMTLTYVAGLMAICLATPSGFSQNRYTIADEDAGGPGSPRVVVLRDSVAHVEAAVAPSRGGNSAVIVSSSKANGSSCSTVSRLFSRPRVPG